VLRIQRCNRVFGVALSSFLLASCVETDPVVLEEPRVDIIDAIDPDLSNPPSPRDGIIVWLSTYSGTGRLLRGTQQIGGPILASGAEMVVTRVSPDELDRGANQLVIRFHPSSGGEVVGQAILQVNARCTWDSHCDGGRCIDFDCVWD